MNFPTTQWSLLARAAYDNSVPARKALEELCGRYWGPIHAFIRSRGIRDPAAQDLTQDFMLHLLGKSLFTRADPLRGRFRSFLLGALVRFLRDAADKEGALKRGGEAPHVSLDGGETWESEALSCPADAARFFDREWALTILESALEHLQREYREPGRGALFATLEKYLPGARETPPYEAGAEQLGLSLPAFKTEVHRLRRRLRALVREEVAQTVSAPHEIEEEMKHLQDVLMERGCEFAQAPKLGAGDS